jgi:cytosine/adenosine deaminase-related metal-dependent hydrolase
MRPQLSTLALLSHAAAASAASVLLSNASAIITFDAETEGLSVLRHGSVLVEGDRIAGLYEGAAPKSLPNGTEIVDCAGKIISPGFIDTHRHGWQTAFKTIGSNTSLAEYFLRYGEYVAGSYFSPEDVYLGQLAGLYEGMLQSTKRLRALSGGRWY